MSNSNMKPYITVGIDLGTTNSAVSVSRGDAYEIVKNSYQLDYTPSVFGIEKSGKQLVGKRAYDKLFTSSSEDEFLNYKAEVKRLMGQSQKIVFPRSPKEFLPEEISAEILRELRADVLKKYPDHQVNAAVITVPAYFGTLQSEATKRAGELAGFDYVVLLQEPIAAALSFGVDSNTDANWLVYDLGGGTFDIALIQSKDGILAVRQHNGDNFLGGKDFDARIVERVFIPRLQEAFSLADLSVDNAEYSYLLTKLKFIAEQSKIVLSTEESLTVELDELGQDTKGEDIYLSFEFSVKDFEEVVADLVEKTIQLVNATIKDSGIEKKSISSIVLVGGPTQLPFIRTRLEEVTKLSVDSTVDLLTAVAKGAAVFGKSQKLPNEILERGREVAPDEVKLTLNYDAMTPDAETLVVGEFAVPAGDYSVQLQSHDNLYVGDKIPLKQGKFHVNLPLPKGVTTTFNIYLIDENENPVPTFPNQFAITQGMSISGAPIPRNIGVVYSKLRMTGGMQYQEFCDVYFKAGSTLPLTHTETFKTLRQVVRGQENELPIKVYEGDSSNIEFNNVLTTLRIDGSGIPYTLPEGSDIEIKITVSESRELEVEAYIPEFDMAIDARVDTYEEEITSEKIADKVETMKRTFAENKEFLPKGQQQNLESKINQLEASSSEELSDTDKKSLMLKETNEILQELERVDEQSSTARAVEEARGLLVDVKQLLRRSNVENKSQIQDQVEAIEADINRYEKNNDLAGLQNALERLEKYFGVLVGQTLEFWLIQFEQVSLKANFASDRAKFNSLRQQGVAAANNEDVDALREICVLMWGLLPRGEAETFDSRLSGVTK